MGNEDVYKPAYEDMYDKIYKKMKENKEFMNGYSVSLNRSNMLFNVGKNPQESTCIKVQRKEAPFTMEDVCTPSVHTYRKGCDYYFEIRVKDEFRMFPQVSIVMVFTMSSKRVLLDFSQTLWFYRDRTASLLSFIEKTASKIETPLAEPGP
jgi:hypothetical protein